MGSRCYYCIYDPLKPGWVHAAIIASVSQYPSDYRKKKKVPGRTPNGYCNKAAAIQWGGMEPTWSCLVCACSIFLAHALSVPYRKVQSTTSPARKARALGGWSGRGPGGTALALSCPMGSWWFRWALYFMRHPDGYRETEIITPWIGP